MTEATQTAAPAAQPSTPATPATSTANTLTVDKAAPAPLRTPTGEKLSIHEAMDRLRADRAKQAKEPAAPAAPAPKEPPPAPVAEAPAAPVDAPAEADEDAIEIEDEAKPAEQAALTPPSSFNAEEKAAFAALPRPAQEAAVRLEATRRAALSRETRAADDARKAAEASVQQVEAERRFLLTQVAPLLQSLQQQHTSDFADIRTPADAARMADVDPARYLKWQAQRETMAAAHQAQQMLAAREQEQQTLKEREAGGVELQKLSQTVKGWNTPEGLQRGMAELKQYVLSYEGVTQEDLALFRKAPFVEMARKASLYDRAVARTKATASAPATASPSPARVASGTALAQTNKHLAQLRETGSIEDAVAALKAQRSIRQR